MATAPKLALPGSKVGLALAGAATPLQVTLDEAVKVPTVTLAVPDNAPTAVGTQVIVIWQDKLDATSAGQLEVATVHEGCEIESGGLVLVNPVEKVTDWLGEV